MTKSILPALLIMAALPSTAQLVNIDYEKLVSTAALTYDQPVSRSEQGMPLGNGTMGSLVWTTPSAIRLQVNRVDVLQTTLTAIIV